MKHKAIQLADYAKRVRCDEIQLIFLKEALVSCNHHAKKLMSIKHKAVQLADYAERVQCDEIQVTPYYML